MPLAGPWGRVDIVVATKALDLLPGAFSGRLHVSAGFVCTDKVAFALCTYPLGGEEVIIEIFEVRLGSLDRFGVDQRRENGKFRQGMIGVQR